MGLLLKLYLLFLKLGFLSFGGGYALMGLIYDEASTAVGLTVTEFTDMAALELLASGPIAINAATYVGFIKGGFTGAVIATLGVCTPSFILVGILLLFLGRFYQNKQVQGFLLAIKTACGGLLLGTVYTLGRTLFVIEGKPINLNILSWLSLIPILICIFCVILMLRFKVDPLKIIAISAILGAFLL